MLTNEVMGAFCLGVVWLNTLLIVAHVWQTQRALAREIAALGPVARAEVARVDGGALASLIVSQIGRATTNGGPDRILFTEASRRPEVREGAVTIDGREESLTAGEGTRVWALSAAGTRAETDFESAHRSASTHKGLASTLTVPVGPVGARVWLAGDRKDGAFVVSLVSDSDPSAIVASARARGLGFIVIALAALAGITALALVRPWFSGWSTLGGALAVAYFLAVQPLAVGLRESIAIPDQRRIGGTWQPTGK